ncbi:MULTISPECIES: 1-aminocyclopropane-1-carboxylate deaminase/D-cysteine desulfhydrase [unclassified Acinetobacter]|uniref:1-aminocyclopropane-1-carboxylate deaminase/D-cysteine desulfhydrase n=1 Tax=unclassified Acinetobacter TaxID=196816 RepID=UPI0035B9A859
MFSTAQSHVDFPTDVNAKLYQTIQLHGYSIMVKRLDLIHPTISGNKFFKLKYHLHHAKQNQKNILISFGGAYSNHIYALAHAGQQFGFKTIGIIRGEELQNQPLNPQLNIAQDLGMQLRFISREQYRLKHTDDFLQQLQADYPDAWIIPEGGTHDLAVQGCQEILNPSDKENDIIACAVGTGGTFSGLIRSPDKNSQTNVQYLGFCALTGEKHLTDIRQTILKYTADLNHINWQLFDDNAIHGFGGYAKTTAKLWQFIHDMQQQNLPLEPIYTGKALYRLGQYLLQNDIPKSQKILFIHTGGLQVLQHSPMAQHLV